MSAELLALLVLAAAPAISAPNLIVNPGFETGDFTGWSGDIDNYEVANVTAYVHSGDYAATTGVFNPGV